MTVKIPPLPNGFVIDQPDGSPLPPLPEGFALDDPSKDPFGELVVPDGFGTNVVRNLTNRAVDVGGNLLKAVDTMAAPLERMSGMDPDQYNTLRNVGQSMVDQNFGYEPRATWETTKAAEGFVPTAVEAARYIAEAGPASIADMVGASLGFGLPYVASRSQEIGETRAKNKGLDQATGQEFAEAVPAALATMLSERLLPAILPDLAGMGIVKGGVVGLGTEATIEALQEGGIEYLGEKLGTGADMSLAEAVDRGLGGAVVGGGVGAPLGAIAGAMPAPPKEPDPNEPPPSDDSQPPLGPLTPTPMGPSMMGGAPLAQPETSLPIPPLPQGFTLDSGPPQEQQVDQSTLSPEERLALNLDALSPTPLEDIIDGKTNLEDLPISPEGESQGNQKNELMPLQDSQESGTDPVTPPLPEGFTLDQQPDTTPQDDLEQKARELLGPEPKQPQPKRGRKSPLDPTVDDLLLAIAKLGGIDTEMARSEGYDVFRSDMRQGQGGLQAFKRGGTSLDDMNTQLAQYGYTEQGSDTKDLEDKISQALVGEQVVSNQFDYGPQQAQQEYDRALSETMAQLDDDAEIEIQQQEAELDALTDEQIMDELIALNDQWEEQWGEPGEIEDDFNPRTLSKDEIEAFWNDVDDQKTEDVDTEGGTDAFSLETQTEQDFQEQAAQEEQRAQQQAEQQRRDEADDALDSFTLTGSNLEADQAAAAGQTGLFDAPQSKPLPSTIEEVYAETDEIFERGRNALIERGELSKDKSPEGKAKKKALDQELNEGREKHGGWILGRDADRLNQLQEHSKTLSDSKDQESTAETDKIDQYIAEAKSKEAVVGKPIEEFTMTELQRTARVPYNDAVKMRDRIQSKPSQETPVSELTEEQVDAEIERISTASSAAIRMKDDKVMQRRLQQGYNQYGTWVLPAMGDRLLELQEAKKAFTRKVKPQKVDEKELEEKVSATKAERERKAKERANLTGEVNNIEDLEFYNEKELEFYQFIEEAGIDLQPAIENIASERAKYVEETGVVDTELMPRYETPTWKKMQSELSVYLKDKYASLKGHNRGNIARREMMNEQFEADNGIDAVQNPEVYQKEIAKNQDDPEVVAILEDRLAKAEAKAQKGTNQSLFGSDYGTKNKLVTNDRADEIRKKLAEKLQGRTSAGIDPEIVALGTELAVFHIEAGARKFADFANAVINDLKGLGVDPDQVTPNLRSWYNGARDMMEDQDMPVGDMDTPEQVREVLKSVKAEVANVRQSRDQESDRQNEPDAEQAAGSDIQDQGRGRGGREAAEAGTETNQGRDAAERMDDGGTTDDRERSDTGDYQQNAIFDEPATGDIEPDRGDTNSQQGIQVDEAPSPAAVKHIESEAAVVQTAGKPKTIKSANRAQIENSMPFLNEGQVDDVVFAEKRFAKPDGYGVLFTNGTGTGKTFTGLGVIKRAVDQGKKVLVITPNKTISAVWVRTAKEWFGVEGYNLKEATTEKFDKKADFHSLSYSALGDNQNVLLEDWDLIVVDEAHKLTEGQQGNPTNALVQLRGAARQPGKGRMIVEARRPELFARMAEIRDKLDSMDRPGERDGSPLNDEYSELMKESRELIEAENERINNMDPADKPRVLMLSATPFAYDKSVQMGQGFLFDWTEGIDLKGFNAFHEGYEKFMMEHFGYRIRNNRLTIPEGEVDSDLMERQFNSWLKEEGVLSSRVLDVDYDYDRKFVLVDSKIGQDVDKALDWLSGKASKSETYRALEKTIRNRFKYHQRMYFLEAIKAEKAVPFIRKNLELGRKVIVLHDFNKGGTVNPFVIPMTEANAEAYGEFSSLFGSLIRAFDTLPSPAEQMQESFGDQAAIWNGQVSPGKRSEISTKFNTGDLNLIVGNGDALKEGVSLHDTDGKNQRVIVQLGMPVKPTAAIQQEGRIYRIGQASDAMFRYITINTNWERFTFGETIAQRAGTAENLALGESARGLTESFVSAYEDAAPNEPGFEGEGTGGKAIDRSYAKVTSAWDAAKSYYFGTQKKNSRNKAQEGVDYFATPEPLGMKMVSFADPQPNDKMLEPSAGHGAIARFFPSITTNRAIEPSRELASRLTLRFNGEVDVERYEDHDVINKYDGIVMNPPFGRGGKTAAEHVRRAIGNLAKGGRIVALVPTGPAADKQFDKLLNQEVDLAKEELKAGKITRSEFEKVTETHLVAEMSLPRVTFERAGTNVSARVIVLERTGKAPEQVTRINMEGAENINEFFDNLEHVTLPGREKQPEEESAKAESVEGIEGIEGTEIESWDDTDTRDGSDIFLAKASKRISKADFGTMRQVAKKHSGYWSRYKGGFLFKDKADRDAFAGEINGDYQAKESEAAYKTADNDFAKMRGLFLDNLDQDADAEEVMEWAEEQKPAIRNFLRALNRDDWLGFDYPSQGINELFTNPEVSDDYELSPGLKTALGKLVNSGELYGVREPKSISSGRTGERKNQESGETRDAESAQDSGRAGSDLSDRAGKGAVRNAGDALNALTKRYGGTALANRIAKAFDVSPKKSVELVGQKVESAADLGALAQIYRDPRFETLRVFYVKNKKIVYQTGLTQRLPNSVSFETDPTDDMNATVKALGADRVYLLHNHPSGDPTPSQPDIKLTRLIARSVPQMAGHIVINSGTFAKIDTSGLVEKRGLDKLKQNRETYDNAEFSIPHEALDYTIDNPSDVAKVAKAVEGKKGMVVVVSRQRNRVSAITEWPADILQKNPKKLIAIYKKLRELTSGTELFLTNIPDRLDYIVAAKRMIRRGFLLDAVVEGQSASLRDQDSTLYPQRDTDHFSKQRAQEEQEPYQVTFHLGEGATDIVQPTPVPPENINYGGPPDRPQFDFADRRDNDKFTRRLLDRFSWIRYQLQDKLVDLKKYQRHKQLTDDMNAYQKAGIWEGKAARALDDLENDIVIPLMEQLKATGMDLDTIEQWLVARHVHLDDVNAELEKLNPKRQGDNTALSGMSSSEAKRIYEEHQEALDELGARIDEINQSHVDMLVERDLLTEKEAMAWRKNKHYVPLKRDFEDETGSRPLTGKGFDIRGPESRKRRGSERDVVDPIANMLAHYQTSIVRAEKNEVTKAFLKMIEAEPNQDFFTIEKNRKKVLSGKNGPIFLPDKQAENELHVKVGGTEYFIAFNSKNPEADRMMRGLKNLDSQVPAILKGFMKLNRLLSALSTSWSPEFLVTNFVRDIQTAGFNLGDTDIKQFTGSVIRMVPSAMNGIRNHFWGDGNSEWAKVFDDFERAGGKTGWVDIHRDINAQKKHLESLFKGYDGNKAWSFTKKAALAVAKQVEYANLMIENAVRLAAFKKARDIGLSEDRAAALAKDLTVNFNRKGAQGATANALYLFYNASIQGNVRMMQAIYKSKRVQVAVGASIGAAMALDIMNRYAAGDDEDEENLYDSLPEYVKNHNLIIWGTPGSKEPLVKIPLPWGYNVIHVLGQEMGRSVTGRRDAMTSAARIANATLTAFNPVSDGTLAQIISPTAVDPFVRTAENKDWHGGALMPEDRPYGAKDPDSERYFSTARPVSVAVAKQLNDLTGGNEIEEGAISISPETFDMLYDFTTGGTGRFVSDSVKIAQKLSKGEELETKEIPFWRRVTGATQTYALSSRYYDYAEHMDIIKRGMKELPEEYRQDPRAKLLTPYNNTQKELRRLRKVRKQVIEKYGRDSDQFEKLDTQMRKVMGRFNKLYAQKYLDTK